MDQCVLCGKEHEGHLCPHCFPARSGRRLKCRRCNQASSWSQTCDACNGLEPLQERMADAIHEASTDGGDCPNRAVDLLLDCYRVLVQMGKAIDWPPEGGGMIDHDDDDRCVATPLDFHHDCPVFVMSPHCPGCQALARLYELINGGQP